MEFFWVIGIVWTNPWRVDISKVASKKNNLLKIEVINMWSNRLIGDAALPPDKLLPSGLLGPVSILRMADMDMCTETFKAITFRNYAKKRFY